MRSWTRFSTSFAQRLVLAVRHSKNDLAEVGGAVKVTSKKARPFDGRLTSEALDEQRPGR
ncbi:MAG: hypothetical protein ACR2GU_10135 [Rubrobacteraceae bacterium]